MSSLFTQELFDAVATGDLGAARLAIERGGDCNAKDEEHRTPLYISVCRLDHDMVDLLTSMPSAKPNPFIESANGDSAMLRSTDRDAVKILRLLSKRFPVSEYSCFCCGGNLLHHAVDKESIDAVDLLLSQGVSSFEARDCGCTPIHRAARLGNLPMLESLLPREKSRLDGVCEELIDGSVLGMCVQSYKPELNDDFLEAAKFLISRGAEIHEFGSLNTIMHALGLERFEFARFFAEEFFPKYRKESVVEPQTPIREYTDKQLVEEYCGSDPVEWCMVYGKF